MRAVGAHDAGYAAGPSDERERWVLMMSASAAPLAYRAIVVRNYRRAFGYLALGETGPDGRKLTLRSFLQLAQMLNGTGGPVTEFPSECLQPRS